MSIIERLRAALDATERLARVVEYPGHGGSVLLLRMIAAHREILDAYEHADKVAGVGISPEGNYANGLEFAVKCIAKAYGITPNGDTLST